MSGVFVCFVMLKMNSKDGFHSLTGLNSPPANNSINPLRSVNNQVAGLSV